MRTSSRAFEAYAAVLFGVLLLLSFGMSAQAQDHSSTVDDIEAPRAVMANDSKYSIAPVVANERAKPRDIIKKELMLTNHTNERIDLYISVENIDPAEGAQEFVSPSVSDLAHSLANWIEVTRGVIKLGPGESRKVPYLIHVNLTAEPGSYFAHIAVTEGPRRPESASQEIGAELILNLEVEDDARERLQLGGFTSNASIALSDSIGFSYEVENVGNRLLEPRGSIRIFNRKGEEVGSVPLNADGVEITPENTKQLAAVWNASGRFGKYKAFLDLEYGENQLASVQDTVYFWVFPWKEIFTAFVGVVVLGVTGTFIVHMRTIARPVPASVRTREAASAYPEPMPRASAHTATQETVLLSPRRAAQAHTSMTRAREQATPHAAEMRGNTVSLTPRRAHATAATHGTTVELAPRTRRGYR